MSRFNTILLGAVVAVAAVAVPAAPAFAHDKIVGSDPAPGEQLQAPPESVSLEFSGDLMQVGDASTIVIVADAEGRDWVGSAPVVDGRTVTVEIAEGMPAAGYEIRWQVVSQDGHPIDGVVPFTVEGAQPPATEGADESESAEGSESAEPEASVAPDDTEASDAAEDDDQGVNPALVVGLVGAALVVAALAFILIRRRRNADGSGTTAE